MSSCTATIDSLYNYGIPMVTLTGSIFSLFCIIVIANILIEKRPKNNMFRYFLVSTMCEFIANLIMISRSYLLLCTDGILVMCTGDICSISFKIYSDSTFYRSSYYLITSLNEIIAFMQAAATIDCFFSINNRLKWFQSKLAFYTLSSLIIVYTFLFELGPYIFRLGIKKSNMGIAHNATMNETLIENGYEFYLTKFGMSLYPKVMIIFDSILVHILLFLIISAFNILIYFKMKESTNSKFILSFNARNSNPSTIRNSSINLAMRSHKKRFIMVIVTGFNYLLGHIGYVPFSILATLFPTISYLWCINNIEIILLFVSYLANYPIYYMFNTIFKRIANRHFRILFYPMWILFYRERRAHRDESQINSLRLLPYPNRSNRLVLLSVQNLPPPNQVGL